MGVIYKELSKFKGSEHRELFFWQVCRYRLTSTLLVLFADKDQLELHTATPITSTATAATTAATVSRSQRSAPNPDQ
jgi:hypothetical protein